MRHIKFRGWHTKNRVMFSPEQLAADQLTLLPTGQFINVHGTDTRLSDIYPVDKFIPLQFTGFVDKNGKEIYEGDILKTEGDVKTHIFWNEKRNQWDWMFVGFDTLHGPMDWEIIGNIYQNPDLLK